MKIGIYPVSSQSGMTLFADLHSKGYDVSGFVRESDSGNELIKTIRQKREIFVERPKNSNAEESRHLDIADNKIQQFDAQQLSGCDLIFICSPSNYLEELICDLKEAGVTSKQIPLALILGRTFATPYLWRILGENYPVYNFSTSPYTSKLISPAHVYLKRRKRSWIISAEGETRSEINDLLKQIFPQAGLTDIAGYTALNNIGAVLHPAIYISNLNVIDEKGSENQTFSFYRDGLAFYPEASDLVNEIDRIRLKCAASLGLKTFGPEDDSDWMSFAEKYLPNEDQDEADIEYLRKVRGEFTGGPGCAVLSLPHWLHITYGTKRLPGELASDAVKRSVCYENFSFAQQRYIFEDIPTGLVPLEKVCRLLNLNHEKLTKLIDDGCRLFGRDFRKTGRNLADFSDEYIHAYLSKPSLEAYETTSR